jgi:hypothetical protein
MEVYAMRMLGTPTFIASTRMRKYIRSRFWIQAHSFFYRGIGEHLHGSWHDGTKYLVFNSHAV